MQFCRNVKNVSRKLNENIVYLTLTIAKNILNIWSCIQLCLPEDTCHTGSPHLAATIRASNLVVK